MLVRLYKYQSDFEVILRASNSSTSKSRFLRLFFVAFTMLVAIIPLQGYFLYYDLTLSLPWHPYSWARIHGPSWYTIAKVPASGKVFFDRWTPVAMGFIIFIFCGFGHDAIRVYRTLLWWLGFGYCFPNVVLPLDSQATPQPPNDSKSATLIGSTVSKTKLLFKRRTNAYNDIETGVRGSIRHGHATNPRKTPWYLAPWSGLTRRKALHRDQDTLLDDMTLPSSTAVTAWAGTSQSRTSIELASNLGSPAKKDSIHVKQVISQQSETQI